MAYLFKLSALVFILGITGCDANNSSQVGNIDIQTNTSQTVSKTTVKPQSLDNYVSPLPDDAPTYTVAMTGMTPPFSYQDDYGIMSGIDVDVIRAIGEEKGFKVELVKSLSWVDMFRLAESNQTDLAMSGVSYRNERAEKYALSDTYFFNPASVVYMNKSIDGSTLEGFTNRRVGAIVNSTSVEYANKIEQAQIKNFESPFLAYSSLIRGDIDATIYDMPVWRHYAKQLPEHKVMIKSLDSKNSKEAYAVIMASKQKVELIQKVNDGLAKIKSNGKLAEIESKWLNL